MAKFILLYKGPATPREEFTPEQSEQLMAAWGTWIGTVGEAMADVGAPFAGGTAVRADGTAAAASDLNGYSVVEAADIDAAKSLCEGHPFLSDGTAKFAVEVYELGSMGM
jgi:hypothetical protein